jgi:hypothetical protein
MTIVYTKVESRFPGVTVCSCGAPLGNHPACQSCGTLIGQGHLDGHLVEYRGYHICPHCVQSWEKFESRIKKVTGVAHEVTLSQLLDSHNLPFAIKIKLWGEVK